MRSRPCSTVIHAFYQRTLDVVLRHQLLTLIVFFATMALSIHLYVIIPKGFFPTQDTGLVTGFAESAQDISPQEMARMMVKLGTLVASDPDVAVVGSAMGSTGSAQTANTGRFFVALKPRDERQATASDIINRLRPQLAKVEGVSLVLQAAQDITVGGRIGRGQYQYTLQDADLAELNAWAPKILAKLQTLPELADTSSDLQNNAPQLAISINRDQAARFGILPEVIDATLNDAFGQRQVAQYYTQTDTYTVVLEVPPSMQGNLQTLDNIYLKSPFERTAGAALNPRHHRQSEGRPTVGVASGTISRGDHLLQPAQGRGARTGDGRYPDGGRRHWQAGLTDGDLPGQCPGVSDLACQRAGFDRRGARRHLHHSRHAL